MSRVVSSGTFVPPPQSALAFWYTASMSVQVTIEVSQQIVICTFTGEINDADILGVRSLIRSHADFDPSFSEILDFSGITAESLTTSAIQQASERASNFNSTSTHVVVAPHDVIFGLARMSQVLAETTRPNAMVVRTIDEAREFLRAAKRSG